MTNNDQAFGTSEADRAAIRFNQTHRTAQGGGYARNRRDELTTDGRRSAPPAMCAECGAETEHYAICSRGGWE